MTTMTKPIGLGLLVVAIMTSVLTGCTTEPARQAAPTSSAGSELVPMTDTPGAAFTCPAAGTFTSPEIRGALESAPLPPEVVLISEQDLGNAEDPSKIDVVVRVCQLGLVGDPLKDVATTVAYAIKQSPAGDSVESLRVSNVANDGHPQAKVRVEDFQSYLFAPDAVCCVNRAKWKFASES
jgi:hypothetical protein